MATTSDRNRDPNTLSNYADFKTVYTTTNFEISFESKCLKGNVILRLESTTDAKSKEVILDTSFLDINSINVDGEAAKYELSPRVEPYGSPLKIPLRQGVKKGEHVEIDVAIQTTNQCTALQWLTPAQTSNKKFPYMFSQCQAIHARSCFPCQDTPDIKSPFTFNITSSHPVIASGIPISTTAYPNDPSGKKVYSFEQKVPIPSYLFALSSGDIAQAPIGPRSIVATGPDELAACKWEFEADTERFIQAAEGIVFPYVWGNYNVLVLPPSFPYGGMENPIFTYATPTVISGDRANVDVIAHELAHSWSGNLASNASWEHFWLNEGWTVYLERAIIKSVHGEAHSELSAIIGWTALTDAVELFGPEHEFTKLVPNLRGKDPDDAFSTIPYEKGYHFLRYLEATLTSAKFSAFIPYYFTTFRGRSLVTDDFRATLFAFFESDQESVALLNQVDWNTWFYKPGLPLKPAFGTELVDQVYALVERWKQKGFEANSEDVRGFSANQKIVFLERVLEFPEEVQRALSSDQIKAMGTEYGFASSGNVEVKSRFLNVGLRAGEITGDVIEAAREMLGNVGRMKFVRPMYRALAKVDLKTAQDTFEKNREFYHPICRGMVEKDLAMTVDGK